ncbi:MAG: DCC1-like thiol-disulfide oxidoreductase family protein [Planctomycetota bacterium]
MRKLTVIFDPSCRLCRRAKAWLLDQPGYVPFEFLPALGEATKKRFPTLDHSNTLGDLTVIADGRAVYRGARAWVLCLWATRSYRGLSLTMGSKAAFPLAKKFVDRISKNRYHISRMLPEECGWGSHGPQE